MANVTAPPIVGEEAGVTASQLVVLARPSSSTTRSTGWLNAAKTFGRTSVGMSVRSQAAPKYAIAGKVRTAAILRNVCIGLLLEAPRAFTWRYCRAYTSAATTYGFW